MKQNADNPENEELAGELASAFDLMPAEPRNDLIIAPTAHDDVENREIARNKIDNLEQALYNIVAGGSTNFKDIEDDGFLTHRFIEGVYARELVIPAGTVVIGKLHKYERICIISGGDCTFVTEFGVRRVSAPFTEVIPPGSKTAVYAHTDVTWTSIFRTDMTEPKVIEDTLTAKDHDEYHRFLEES